MARMNRTSAVVAAGIMALVCASMGLRPAHAMEDDTITTFVEIEQLEYRIRDGKEAINWDAQAWVGGDYHKLWFKTEGEAPVGERVEEAEFQLLYSRLVSDFFDLQVGLRQDLKPEPERTFAVVGLHGLAKYFVETDLAAFVSHAGEVSFRAKGEIDLRLTQRLVLQPMAEVNFAVQSVEESHIGSGFNDVELGLRLRYEIAREFAPYVGINWDRKLGETADLARDDGERVDSFAIVAGLRFWF